MSWRTCEDMPIARAAERPGPCDAEIDGNVRPPRRRLDRSRAGSCLRFPGGSFPVSSAAKGIDIPLPGKCRRLRYRAHGKIRWQKMGFRSQIVAARYVNLGKNLAPLTLFSIYWLENR
jgi:hypothetical protein